jgi:hypothetical protein
MGTAANAASQAPAVCETVELSDHGTANGAGGVGDKRSTRVTDSTVSKRNANGAARAIARTRADTGDSVTPGAAEQGIGETGSGAYAVTPGRVAHQEMETMWRIFHANAK